MLIQFGLISSLPGFWHTLPLFFAYCLYNRQTNKEGPALWWLLFFGCLHSFLLFEEAPYEWISYSLSCVIAWWSSKRLFSNQSLYGVVLCAGLAFLLFVLSQDVFLYFVYWIKSSITVQWDAVIQHQAYAFASVLILTAIMYLFIPRTLAQFGKKSRPINRVNQTQ